MAGEQGAAYELWLEISRRQLELGMNNSQMADFLGVDRETVTRLKTSPRRPYVPTVQTIARALGIPYETAAKMAGISDRGPETDLTVREAIAQSASYSPEQRKLLLDLVDLIDRANSAAPPNTGDVPRSGDNRSVEN